MFDNEYNALLNDLADTAMLDDNGTRDAVQLAKHIVDDHLFYAEDMAIAALGQMSDIDLTCLFSIELEAAFISELADRIEELRD